MKFTNWKSPSVRQLLKEYKVEHELKGNKFWGGKRDFIEAVKNAKVEKITREADKGIDYRSRTRDKGELLGLIKGYRSYPKFRNEGTLNAIYEGYAKNAPMDRPIVVDFGNGKRRVLSGNTRMDAAFHSGVDPEALVVSASKKNMMSRKISSLKEFRYYVPAVRENPYDKDFLEAQSKERSKDRRSGLIKAGMIGAGIAGGGALLGRGLIKAGFAAQRADDLQRQIDAVKAMAGAATKKADDIGKAAVKKADDVLPPKMSKVRQPASQVPTVPPQQVPPPPQKPKVSKASTPPKAKPGTTQAPTAADKEIVDQGRSVAPEATKIAEDLEKSGQISAADKVAEIQEKAAATTSGYDESFGDISEKLRAVAREKRTVVSKSKGKAKTAAAPKLTKAQRERIAASARKAKREAALEEAKLRNAEFRRGTSPRQKFTALPSAPDAKPTKVEKAASKAAPKAAETKPSAPPKFVEVQGKKIPLFGDNDEQKALYARLVEKGASEGRFGPGKTIGDELQAIQDQVKKELPTPPKGRGKKKALSARLRGMRYFNNFQTDEGGVPFTGKVARDRFIKKLRDEDLDRRDANILRAGGAGALAGLMFRGKVPRMNRALIGAGLGGAAVIGTRMATDRTRDIYGERSRGAKQVEALPALAGLGAAAWLGVRRMKGLSARFDHRGHGGRRVLKEFGSSALGRLYRKKLALLVKGSHSQHIDPKTGLVKYREQKPLPQDRDQYAGIFYRLKHKGVFDEPNLPLVPRGTPIGAAIPAPKQILKFPDGAVRLDGRMIQADKYDRNYTKYERLGKFRLSARLRGLKEFEDYKLYYFKGRNTGIAARSAEEARKKKKRGGDELVAVRTPSDTERSQMARGIWVRTRRDGKSPGQSRYGKGRGQGPARKEMGAKFFEKRKEKKSGGMNPYVGAALSGGASGALLGGLSILKRGVSPLSALGTAGKLGAVSAGIVGGGALIGSRIVGPPREDEGAPFTKRAGLGGVIAGAGVGMAGGLALRKTRGGARMLVKASKNWRPAMWIRKSPLVAGASVGTVAGALYGGAQGLDEGQQVDSIRNLKKDLKSFGRKLRLREFGAIKDALRWYRGENMSGMQKLALKQARKASPQAAMAMRQAFVKDNRSANRLVLGAGVLPPIATTAIGVGATYHSAGLGKKKEESKKEFGRGDQARWDLPGTNQDSQFAKTPLGWATNTPMYTPKRDKQGRIRRDGLTGEVMRERWDASTPQLWNAIARDAAKQRVTVQRGGSLTRDVYDVARGAERRRDASGRLKKREWEKSWFQNKAAEIGLTLAGVGGYAGVRYAHNNPDTKAGVAWKNAKKSYTATKVGLAEVGAGIMRGLTSATARRFSAKLTKLRELDAIAAYEGWDVRDPRGRSARVFAPGSRRRERRTKEWHEKTENERKLWKAGLVASALGGAGAMLIGQRILAGKSLVPSRFIPKKPDSKVFVDASDLFKKGAA